MHGLCCSKASASYSVRCKATANTYRRPRHIVAWVRFHWSCEERCCERKRFSTAWFILAVSARARRCTPRMKHNRGFGFQSKVKDRFLNQRRWTCWYSCRKNHVSPVSDSQFSLTFWFEKRIFAVYITLRNGGFPSFLYYYLFNSSGVCWTFCNLLVGI